MQKPLSAVAWRIDRIVLGTDGGALPGFPWPTRAADPNSFGFTACVRRGRRSRGALSLSEFEGRLDHGQARRDVGKAGQAEVDIGKLDEAAVHGLGIAVLQCPTPFVGISPQWLAVTRRW